MVRLLFLVEVMFSIMVVALRQLQVRIRRPKICKLACKAQGERIFAAGEDLVITIIKSLEAIKALFFCLLRRIYRGVTQFATQIV